MLIELLGAGVKFWWIESSYGDINQINKERKKSLFFYLYYILFFFFHFPIR